MLTCLRFFSCLQSVMSIHIFNIDRSDIGDYHCVAKNELSVTRGLAKLYGEC